MQIALTETNLASARTPSHVARDRRPQPLFKKARDVVRTVMPRCRRPAIVTVLECALGSGLELSEGATAEEGLSCCISSSP